MFIWFLGIFYFFQSYSIRIDLICFVGLFFLVCFFFLWSWYLWYRVLSTVWWMFCEQHKIWKYKNIKILKYALPSGIFSCKTYDIDWWCLIFKLTYLVSRSCEYTFENAQSVNNCSALSIFFVKLLLWFRFFFDCIFFCLFVFTVCCLLIRKTTKFNLFCGLLFWK